MTYPQWDMEAVNEWQLNCRHSAAVDFCSLHPVAQVHYQYLAAIFAGSAIYAVGSWVNGGYLWPGDCRYKEKVNIKARAYGKLNKQISDFDFYLSEVTGAVTLPEWADQPRVSRYEHKILLPMWDFSKLPENRHAEIIQAAQDKDYLTIIRLHNEYHLSPYFYCCATDGLINWVEWGVKSGKLKS